MKYNEVEYNIIDHDYDKQQSYYIKEKKDNLSFVGPCEFMGNLS